MNYIERYGLPKIKRHLERGTRYFKTFGDYAGTGVCAFNAAKFAFDLGVTLLEFPFRTKDQSGWRLRQPPTSDEIDAFLASRAALPTAEDGGNG